ncbi:MotA/TolQ/ExbB proton channel family protein [Stieleria sp. JC731]|uniref:MotA/TolQ/ExbB proton channel family protein n=1 Tax=Pirellulaceae TaxID=2691357 RepID=UPI001E318241|nr:MotA/TolQ/ExbB proton channel family protein [Stieleria sp. JC731]MCC9599674.1 MotA/TolQ/ExbB proton channel family protein [Stieleria sp. JC731]
MSLTEKQNAAKQSPTVQSDEFLTQWMGPIALIAGGVLSGVFYAVVLSVPWAPLKRYFLGHPVAIAATVLFCVAVAILAIKFWDVRRQWKYFRSVSDQSLAPRDEARSPAGEFRSQYDAGFVAKHWDAYLGKLPRRMASSQLVVRLREVLHRQSGRGTTKHLADDLRELSSRDADQAHTSFALVRIIVWAIPMLGFLGTVIGITQTLGGLDFSSGTAAVDNLKSGLYVAFDTTALGLVLSIAAIFLQFPVEKNEQELLAAIDERVGVLTGLHLPGDEPADNQFELLASLCEGVRAAVAESLSNQTTLWRETIDEAQGVWAESQERTTSAVVDAISSSLAPALRDHASEMAAAARHNRKLMEEQFGQWQSQLGNWQEAILAGAEAMTHQQGLMLEQVDEAALVREQAQSVLQLQQTLASNVEMLEHSNRRIDENLGVAAGQGMAEAMMVLARAVDTLSTEMSDFRLQVANAIELDPEDSSSDDRSEEARRAA